MTSVYKLDGIPSDLLTSPVTDQRRFKTSSRTSIEGAAINGVASIEHDEKHYTFKQRFEAA